MRASYLLIGLLALSGCPDPTPPAPPPERPAGVGAGNPTRPVAKDPTTTEPPPAAGDQASEPKDEGGAGEGSREELIAARTVRRSCANLAVAVGAIRSERAQLTVSSGQVSFRADVGVGERLSLCSVSELEVLAVSAEGVRVRWLREVDDPLGEVEAIKVAPEGLRLAPMNLYRLPGGEVIGVGNVRDGAVNLSAFPKGYERDPMQDWDLHRGATVGVSLKAVVLPLEVVGVEADAVTLQLP